MAETSQPAQAPRRPGRLARTGTFIRDQAAFAGKNLFVEGIGPRGTILAKWASATQLIASGYALASESLKGATYAQIMEKLKGSLFLDTMAQSLVKDGQWMNNLDAYALIGLMLPSIVGGVRKGASAKVGILIAERERMPLSTQENGTAEAESVPAETETLPEPAAAAAGYVPTAGDRLKAYCTTVLEKIPKYIAATYASMVMLKTDLYTLGAAVFTPKAAAAQQAVGALKDSFSSTIVGTALGIYIMYQGIRLYLAKKSQ